MYFKYTSGEVLGMKTRFKKKTALKNTFSNCFKFLSLALLIYFAFFSCNQSYAAEQSTTPKLQLVYLPKQNLLDDLYKPEEHLRERFKIYAKYLSNDVSFVPGKFSATKSIQLLNSGEGNMLAFVVKTAERMFQLKFSKNPAISAGLYVVADEQKDLFYDDSTALNGKTIAIYAGNSMEKASLEDYLVEKNITMQYKIYEDYEEYVRSKDDFHLTNSLYFIKGKQIIALVGKQDFYFATTAKHAHLLNILDYAMEQANKNDAAALRKIYNEYISKQIHSFDQKLNAVEKSIISKPTKIYQIGYNEGHFPIQYIDEQKKPAGLAQEVHLLFKKMHDTPNQLTAYSVNTSKDLTQYDMLFSIVGHKRIKEKFFYTSKAYLNLPMVIFENVEATNSQIHKLGMLNYSVLDHKEIQNHFPHWKLKTFNTYAELFAAYENKQIDAMFMSKLEAEYTFATIGTTHNKLFPTAFELPLKFYLSKKYSPAALNILNSFIDKLDPISLQTLVLEQESAMRAPSTFSGLFDEHQNIVLAFSIFIVFLIVVIHVVNTYIERKKFLQLSLTDSLTGLSTKEHAYAIMNRVMSTALPGEYMVFCVDIDKFTLLNQVYGRKKGNEVLCLLAKHFQKKYNDKYETECVARLRDDVFLVLAKAKPILEALEVDEEVLVLVNDVENLLQSNYSISMSKGCYIIDDVTLPIETIIDYCNTARHACKDEHAISTKIFDEDMKNALNVQKDIIHKMENGIANDEFVLNFQPKVRLENENICGAEVLVRWHLKDGTTIYPDDFISTFEANAFITKFDLHVFEKTCQFIKKHRDSFNVPSLAVNFSGLTILHDDTYMYLRDIMQHYNVSPNEIEIEITESAMVSNADAFSKNIELLCRAGFIVSIDDFGTGVSSLHRLSTLCVHTVKLDKSFLDDKFNTKNGVFLVASVINMLRRLGIQVIAEGVETARHVMILKKLRCDIAQGYFYSKPLNEQLFVKKLIDSSAMVKFGEQAQAV